MRVYQGGEEGGRSVVAAAVVESMFAVEGRLQSRRRYLLPPPPRMEQDEGDVCRAFLSASFLAAHGSTVPNNFQLKIAISPQICMERMISHIGLCLAKIASVTSTPE